MAMSMWPESRLGRILDGMERQYPRLTEPRFDGPLEMILWEIVAYLADDARRGWAFKGEGPAYVIGQIGHNLPQDHLERSRQTAARPAHSAPLDPA